MKAELKPIQRLDVWAFEGRKMKAHGVFSSLLAMECIEVWRIQWAQHSPGRLSEAQRLWAAFVSVLMYSSAGENQFIILIF